MILPKIRFPVPTTGRDLLVWRDSESVLGSVPLMSWFPVPVIGRQVQIPQIQLDLLEFGHSRAGD